MGCGRLAMGALMGCGEFLQRAEKAVHLFGGVVMHQPDTQQAAVLFNAQPLGEIERVVVAVPCEDAAVAEELCHLERRVSCQSHGHSRYALSEARRVRDPEET